MKQLQGLACILLGLLLVAFPADLLAQSATTGQVAGTIKDPSGAVVPAAKITLASETGVKRAGESDSTGYYAFPLLPPGVYKLEVTLSGFKPVTVDKVRVKITETTTADVTLEVGTAQETITVTAEAPLLQATSPTAGRVVEETIIRQLPLPTRNFQQLLALQPGTIASIANNTELGRGDTSIFVNGQRATSNNVVLNGTEINSPGTNSTPNIAVPATDAIQEFKVQTSLYDATQGRNAGGNVAAVTKSGSNDLHGNVYWFHRNTVLNANDFFLNRSGQRRPVLLKNQFGFTLGGPIVKDKTFFFGSYQGTRERNGASLSNSLTFVNLPAGLTDANRTAAGLAAAFGLTAADINAVTLAILQARLPNGQFAIPSPQATGLPASALVPTALSALSRFREDQFNINIDHQIRTDNKLSAKFFFSNTPSFQGSFTFQGVNVNQLPGYGGDFEIRNRVFSLHDTHIFSPSLINEARFGYSRIFATSAPEEPFTATQFGIRNPLGNLFPGMPTIGVTGLFTIGSTTLADEFSMTETYTYSDTVSWTHGRHTLRIGGEARRSRVNFAFNFFSRGQLTFNTFTDFLRGRTAVSLLGSGVPDRGIRATDLVGFFQDDWRATDRLTLNVGFRYEHLGGLSEVRGRLVNFLPDQFRVSAPPNGFVQPTNAQPELPGVPKLRRTLNPNDSTFAPRFGFAWKPTKSDRFVLRGGMGVYFDRFSTRMANVQIFNYPYGTVAAGVALVPALAGLPFADPFPTVIPQPTAFPVPANIPTTSIFNRIVLPNGISIPSAVAVNGIYVDQDLRTPYSYQYSLSTQWEFARNWLAELGYVGSKGTKLINVHTMNQSPVAQPFSCAPLVCFSTNKNLFGMVQVQSSAVSHYDSLQLSVTKRLSHGLQFLASYTFARSIDDYSGAPTTELAPPPGNQQNRGSQRARSDFDRTHRFVYSFVYDLPKFYGGDSKLGKSLLNDWELAGIITLQSGLPFSAVQAIGASIFNRADLVSTDITRDGSVNDKLDRYFNTAAFRAPVATSANPFGNSGRNILTGPDQRNVDFSIIKFFPITERQKLEFRTEFFNIFNTVNFANPNNNIAVPATFGRVTAASAGPRVIQFALKYSF